MSGSGGILECVAKALYDANHFVREWEDERTARLWHAHYRAQALAAIGAMRSCTLIYRENGDVVHEMRGAPDDIWKSLLDAAIHDEPTTEKACVA